MQSFGIKAKDKVAIMLNNCPEWVFAEQAALSLGAIVVPLYTNDRPGNIAFILTDADISILIIKNDKQTDFLEQISTELQKLSAIITLETSHKDSLDTASSGSHAGEIMLPTYYYQDKITGKHHSCLEYNSNPDDLNHCLYIGHYRETKGCHAQPSEYSL
ncbi:MAG: AMP-binding protein [gamma proteobacterium symbiont of Bathyaustriella thionipta]|nr:AMP-binding protein [gamma proteobacterium symbiont of Bathyaustriella thionipta]MCU7950317.1 AMP-binding protein [gamma proteobacterium symbiont of Bathyaustriella thionipta]MCU7954592.1 AMP-binding protein [gamma proteobacterium symbiont of Bathyaustriella thionipta]MCU7956841.1 AMP-binding protein [gamma proteobacterium symbiont of Bathyaustriella thionipta]MCU7965911.1 AMP-binding protein [gamma proteobacterium symbiont of Bathyaustriella thionipta]